MKGFHGPRQRNEDGGYKLFRSQVETIKDQLRMNYKSLSAIARDWHVTYNTIWQIKEGRIWAA